MLCNIYRGGISINTSIKVYVTTIVSLSISLFAYSLITLNYENFRHSIFLALAFLVLSLWLNREMFIISNKLSTFITLPITLPAIIFLEPFLAGIYALFFSVILFKRRKVQIIKVVFNACSPALIVMVLAVVFQKLKYIHSIELSSPLFFLYVVLAGFSYAILFNGLIMLAFAFENKKIDSELVNTYFSLLKTSSLTMFLGLINVFIFYYFGIIGIAISTFIIYFMKPVINFQSILNNELSTFTDFVLHIIKLYDPITHSHSERVKKWTIMIAKEMKLSSKEIHELSQAASWHDIGKIEIPNEIINKDGKLTDNEYELVKAHPEIGYQLVKDMHFFKDYLPVIRYHHERMDGQGYPLGLQGNEIPLHARIMCVADSFDAMTSQRSYKQGMTMQEAVEELERCAGTQFDAKIVETFVRALKKQYGTHFQEWDKQVANF
jgi:HD-GYP domain-containing protein (c-di-GMP phosphodiesterase class II)